MQIIFCQEILNNINVEAIYLTHGHLDHTGAAEELHQKLNVSIYGHPLDEPWYKDVTCISLMGMPKARPLTKVNPINDKDEVNFGSQKVEVIHTPGHTAGSVCYLLKDTNTLFTGDTLFRRSVGRTDLPGGNSDEIRKSIKNKLFKLSNDVRVYPGHNDFTSIGYEKENNMIV